MSQKNLFFSIIIPAHNEKKYIAETLQNIKNLEYPAGFFESFVIENGSTDKTLEVAKNFESKNIVVVSSPDKGVSKARNIGIEKISPKSDWTIFLDADTILKQNFLKDLNEFLIKRENKNYTVGTTELSPLPNTLKARLWFWLYNIGHQLTKTSMSIFIVKSSLLSKIRFNENLRMGEDLMLIKEASKQGCFFYLPTKDALTSTRRFEQIGWWKIYFSWTFVALLPQKTKQKFDYKVIR